MAKRLKKTTRQQYEHLLNYIEQNRILVFGKTNRLEAQKVDQLWEAFAVKMNNSMFGSIKTATQWKKVFIEWKVNTKRKSRNIAAYQYSTDRSATIKSLTDLEERLLNLISEVNLGDPLQPDTFVSEEQFPEVEHFMVTDIKQETPVISNINSTEEHDYTKRSNFDGFETERKQIGECSINTTVNSPKYNKVIPESDEYSTHSLLKSACDSYVETSKVNGEDSTQAKATFALADAINKLAEAQLLLAKAKREQAKINYYQTFGNLDNFEL